MAGYVRQSSFTEGDIIRDTDHNAEYDAIAQTYDAQAGHKHDGTPNEGPVIPLIGDTGTLSPRNKVEVDSQNNKIKVCVQAGGFSVEQVSFGEGVILPATDNYLDLGTSGYKFKDAYVYNLYAQNIDGFEIGVDVQPYSGVLSTLSGVAPSDNTLPYFTGPNAASVTSLSSFGRSLIDDSNAGAARTTLGATTVGSNLFTLTDPSAVRFLRVNADNSVSALNSSDFRAAIGLGSLATQSSVDDSDWSGTALSIPNGGTGATTAANARNALGLSTVSKEEAEAGTSTTTRAWTAQRVKQAIDAIAETPATVLLESRVTATTDVVVFDLESYSEQFEFYTIKFARVAPAVNDAVRVESDLGGAALIVASDVQGLTNGGLAGDLRVYMAPAYTHAVSTALNESIVSQAGRTWAGVAKEIRFLSDPSGPLEGITFGARFTVYGHRR